MKPINLIRKMQLRTFASNNQPPKFNIFDFMGNKTVAEREKQHEGFLKQELFGADYYHYESPQYQRERYTLNIGLLVLAAIGGFFVISYRKDVRRTLAAYNKFTEDLKFDNVEFKPNK